MRHLLAYLVFVGIPFAGLMGVLRLGQGIRAPQAVHGRYAVTHLESAGTCQAYLLSGDSSLTMTQSGTQVTASLGRAGAVTLRGHVEGSTLTLAGVVPVLPPQAACPAGDTVRLVGQARRAPDHGHLDGTLAFLRCADCSTTEFHAKRMIPTLARGL
ncbi:MAG TPA: hypothetical protein VFJ92_17505 [Gemmatimonadales bacterium]|nr:hypothetical protein [Gemmatimonadales bacterium]